MDHLPSLLRTMATLGEQLRLARLRRRLGTVQVAERAGIARQTLYRIERGDPAVGLGLYAQVLLVLGLEKDLLKVAQDDVLGRKLQDAQLPTKQRAPKRRNDPR
jgi:transcriptional regulator with XRE-family HTH domain